MKPIAILIGSVKVALFSIMTLGDVWFELSSEKMVFMPSYFFFHVFNIFLTKFSKTGLFTWFNDTHREKLFYSIQYNNGSLAASDVVQMFTQSIKLYTFCYHVLREQMFEKCDSSNRQ